MTAATSQKNKSFFLKRIRNNLSDCSRLLIVNIVLSIVALPCGCITALYSTYLDQINSPKSLTFEPDGFIAASTIAFIITVLLGLVIALHCFRYQFKKSLTDMNYALPLNNKHRFFADYLSGLAVYVLPHIGAVLLTLGILAFSQSIVDDARDLMQEHLREIFICIWVFIVALVMFYTICVLALNFAGSKFEAIFSCIALNIMIPSVIICTMFNAVSSASFGIESESLFTSNMMTTSSPIGCMIYLIVLMEEYDVESYFASVSVWSVLALITTAIYLILAYILYKIRKAENVSKPYVFKWYYYLVLISAVYCFLSVFFLSDTDIMPAIVISAIMWFILEVITRRGFKKIWVGALCFVGAVAVAFGIRSFCDSSKGFGITKYVPSKSMVSSAIVSIDTTDHSIYSIQLKDRESIEDVVDLHALIVDKYKHPENYSYKKTNKADTDNKKIRLINDTATVKITYNLRNGLRCTRSYACTSDMTEKLMTDILLSDSYAEQSGDILYDEERLQHRSNYSDEPVLKDTVITVSDKFDIVRRTNNLNIEDLKRLSDAYTSDFKNMTADDLKKHDIWGTMSGNYRGDLFILSSFDKTIGVLEELGYEKPELTVDAMESDYSHGITAAMIGLYPEPIIYAHENDYYKEPNSENSAILRSYYPYMYDYYDIKNCTEKDTTTCITARTDYSSKSYLVSADLIEFDKDMLALLDRATSILINEKIAGVLEVNGYSYFIPDEGDNAELVERVYKSQFSDAVSTNGSYYR